MSSEELAGSEREHPGLELHRLLEQRNIADSELADRSGLSRPLISQITNGNRRITSSSSAKICKVIGGDPVYWVKRQQEYDLYISSRKTEAIAAAQRAAPFGR